MSTSSTPLLQALRGCKQRLCNLKKCIRARLLPLVNPSSAPGGRPNAANAAAPHDFEEVARARDALEPHLVAWFFELQALSSKWAPQAAFSWITPALFERLKAAAEGGDAAGRTQVENVQAHIEDFQQLPDRYQANVQFRAMIREATAVLEVPLFEIWRFELTRPLQPHSRWQLVDIDEVSTSDGARGALWRFGRAR